MALKIKLKGTSPGFADLAILGGGSDPGPVEITIQRSEDEHYLAQGGTWQTMPFWHSISSVVETTDGILASVGPEIVDPIVECSRMMFLVAVKSTGINGQQVMTLTGRLLGSGAAGPGYPPPPPEPELEPEPEPETVNDPPDPVPLPPGPRVGLWITIALLLLVLAAVVAWYLGLFGDRPEPEPVPKPVVLNPEPDPKPVVPEPVPEPEPIIDRVTDTSVSEQTEPPVQPTLTGRARAQALLRTNPPPAPESMLTTALEWENDGDCEAAIIVLNSAAAVDVSASKVLAERYDPASFSQDGCIETADAETAIYWYEQPADQGDQAAQSRLGLLLTERNTSGPLYERGLAFLRKASKSGDPAATERLRKLGEEL